MKNKKGQIVNLIIGLSVTLIIGIVIFSVVQSIVLDQTSTTAITDDQFTADNSTCVRVTADCFASGSATVENATSGVSLTGNFTQCGQSSDWYGLNLKADGKGLRIDGATVNTSYSEISCNQIQSGTTTTVIQLLPLLFAVLLLVFVAGFIVLKR